MLDENALKSFAETWSDDVLTGDISEQLSCTELESLLAIFRMVDREDVAAEWIRAHVDGSSECEGHGADVDTRMDDETFDAYYLGE
jgi:hypothetical protein